MKLRPKWSPTSGGIPAAYSRACLVRAPSLPGACSKNRPYCDREREIKPVKTWISLGAKGADGE